MRLLSIILTCTALSLVTSVHSQFRVNNNSGIGSTYSNISEVLGDVTPVDNTILVEHSSDPYDVSGVTIAKEVILYGTGYYLPDNPQTQADTREASVSSLSFGPGSEGSTVSGLTIDNLTILADDITIERCFIRGKISIGSASITPDSPQILRCIIKGSENTEMVNIVNASNFVLSNNYIENENAAGAYNVNQAAGDGLVLNNLFFGEPDNLFKNVTIQNNAFQKSEIDAASTGLLAVTNNISESTFLDVFGESTNKTSWPPDSIYCIGIVPSRDARFGVNDTRFLPGGTYAGIPNPALGMGSDGSDISIFGGAYPYVLSGMPQLPSIYDITGGSSGTQSGGTTTTVKGKGRK